MKNSLNSNVRAVVLIYLFAIVFSSSNAQKVISLNDAITMMLERNFDIRVAKNEVSISQINNTLGNAGMLPTVAANASNNFNINSISQKQNGTNSSYSSNTNATKADLALNWTLFDGGKMFVTKQKLNEIEKLGELEFRNQVQQSIFDVTTAYYNVVRQTQQLAFIHEVILFNRERVKISQTTFDAGLAPKNNVLQAKIDLNVFLENEITQQNVIAVAKRNLNHLLNISIDTVAFNVADSIPLGVTSDSLKNSSKLYASNYQLMVLEKQKEISKLTVREIKSTKLPKVSFNAGYGLNQNSYSNEQMSFKSTTGPVVGASVFIPIYQAGNTTRQIKIAQVQQQSLDLAIENVKNQLNIQLLNAFSDFEQQRQLLIIEQENTAMARENLTISMERLRLGQTTSLEVHQAQESYQQSTTRLVNFRYNLKIAEIKLKFLFGKL